MRQNPWLKSTISGPQNCISDKIDDCNTHWAIKMPKTTGNSFDVDEGLKVACRKFKQIIFQLINYQFNTIFFGL